MTDSLLGNLFSEASTERQIFKDIKVLANKENKDVARLNFNFYYYDFLYAIKNHNHNDIQTVVKCLYYFIAKEDLLSNQIAAINNTYQMSVMTSFENLFDIATGRQSNLIVVNSDAARMGALIALAHQLFHVSKLDILSKTLSFAQIMV